MKIQNVLILFSIVCVAFLLSACSSSAPVTPIATTPAPQEQTPNQSATVPTESQPVTSAPSESANSTTTVTQPEPTPVEPTPTVNGVSATELALHNSKSDCWVVYQNEVYDVTSYLPKHPGGVLAISKHCGTTTFEKAFTGQHGTGKVKTFKTNTINVGAYLG